MASVFGGILKKWRTSRRMSQEQLAFDAEISTRHLSFLENGKANPSREMVLLLASALTLELRERNAMLTCAGFAPVYTSNTLESLELEPVRRAIDLILAKQEPYGAVVVDRAWNVLKLNSGAVRLLERFVPKPPDDPKVMHNVLKALVHPEVLRPCIVNWVEVATFVIERLDAECALFPHDEARLTLREEVLQYPGVAALRPVTMTVQAPAAQVHLKRGDEEARIFSMLTTIGTPLDVTAQELAIESYFPADDATDRWFKGG